LSRWRAPTIVMTEFRLLPHRSMADAAAQQEPV